jgi:hypothetical protein
LLWPALKILPAIERMISIRNSLTRHFAWPMSVHLEAKKATAACLPRTSMMPGIARLIVDFE